ncbi:unnamed protein product [Pocillopora meandrina]|uniref:Alpha-methylacyl-CoA racemase n=1 Tax=Pocillopora meandrina TaxID=46732 RepID=A0AAU9Y4F0_9CNID|nr:unnamed protein product [Pocillopora meandrina]
MAALAGIRVVELAGLAPAPFCGMILADFGALVTRIDKVRTMSTTDRLARGKRSISVDLQTPEGMAIVRKLCLKSDVLIEPFRPGVMERLGLGPEILLKDNPRLIYARLTGSQSRTGCHTKRAGHDINYVSQTGLLSKLGRKDEKPTAPINLLADFAGGGLSCAFGILLALFERSQSGEGQVVDASMVDGAAYLGSFIYKSLDMGFIWQHPERGRNLLDSNLFMIHIKHLMGDTWLLEPLSPSFIKILLKGSSWKKNFHLNLI